ncbi:MAG: ester cyclase [Chloroflexota bacterium]|nr:ester cyclase [Chloroflexota bacterium]
MSLEENKALVRRLIEEDLNLTNLTAANEIIAEDFFDHTNPPGMQHGLDGHKQIVALFSRSFPDLKWTINDMIAEGDKVAIRVSMEATHLGDFFGIPPTGNRVMVEGIHVLRCANGKIAEHWGNNDDMGLMRQLGVVPATA